VSAHRATLEEAYMELTREVVDFRAVPAGGSEGSSPRTNTEKAPK
jgi:hypothetical protein